MAADDKNINTPAGNGILDMEALKRRALEIDAMPEGEEKERQKFLLSQDYEGLKEIYGADLVSSEAMFNEQIPEGRNAGGIYVAANPLEFLSSALRQGIGASGRRNTMDKLKQLSADKAEGLRNTMFGQGGQVAQAQGNHNMPVAGMAAAEAAANQTQAQKPDYRQYGYGDPVVRAGMAQLQGRDIPQHVQNSADRRSKAAAAGVELPPPGTGPIGQLKQSVGINPRSEALRAMGGMGKPDLSRYGAPDINAGWGQQTPRPRQESRTVSGDETRRLMGEELAGKMAANTGGEGFLFGAGVRPYQLTEQQQSLFDLINRRDRRF